MNPIFFCGKITSGIVLTNTSEVTNLTHNKHLFSNLDLKKLIVPLIIEQALMISVGMIDTIMVSGVGEAQVSGVSLVDMINNLIICIFAALATGGTVVVSQFLGAKEKEKANRASNQLIVVTFFVALAVTFVCLALNSRIIRLVFGKIETDVFEACTTYFRITALSFPFLAVYNCSAALFRAIGNSKVSMYASAFSNVINAVGNYMLIYEFDMGVAGAAAATTFARFVSMFLMLWLLTNRKNAVFVDFRRRFSFDFAMIKRILYIGVPSSVENSIFELGRILVVSIISGFGTVQIAANAVANTMDAMGCIIGKSMGLAILAVVGRCVGTGDYSIVTYYIKKLMRLTYSLHALWNVLLLATLPLTLKLFNLSPETNRLAMLLIVIHNGYGIVMWCMSFAFPNALRAANDVRFTMVTSISSMFLFRITLSIVLGQLLQLGAVGVWIGMCVDWTCRGTVFYLRYRSGKWKKQLSFDV